MINAVLSAQEEERLLQRACAKGWLSGADLRPEARPNKADTAAVRFGPRLDALLAADVLSAEAVAQLLQEELVASRGQHQDGSLGAVQTLPGPAAAAPSEPPSATAVPVVLPVPNWDRYQLLSVLGAGGMGTVYRARDLRLQRLVAVKFLRAEHDSAVQRFLQEARAQGRIEHDYVCKVYEVGEVEGKSYIAMELVNGLPLHSVMDQLRLEEKMCLVRDAAEALHAAHRLGIVHRDVKPSNILTQRREDGTWRPVVMDFGLAHDAESDQSLTRSGMVMGTPAYMSPEQARGDIRNLDRRTDVYGLGATLFELLTGRPPFLGDNQTELLMSALTVDPPLLRGLQPGLPVYLETLVEKCLQKDPAQRYQSARALAEDIQRYLNGERIQGRRTSLTYRLRRKAQKHRAAVTVACLALLGLSVLGIYSIQARLQVRREKAQAAARAKVSQELGQNLKEMEWFMRSVHQLPLHDISYARVLLQARMKKQEALRPGLGEAGEGLIQYALGHGAMALQDYDQAYTHLVLAQRKGYDTPELRWVLGRVLGEQYQKRLEEAVRTGDVSFVQEQKKALGDRYLKPALALLRGSQGVELESPQLLAAFIALYNQEYDQALQKAAEAARQAPWLYEAKKLAGDVHFALAIDQRNQSKLDDAKQSFERAIGKYQEAAEIGRSDAQLYDAIAESYLQWGDIATNLQQHFSESALFTQANSYCQKSLTTAPERASCYSKSARAYTALLFANQMQSRPLGLDLQKAIAVAHHGLAIDPNDAFIYDALGNGYHSAANGAEREIDKMNYFRLSIESFQHALTRQPKFPNSLTNLGYTHLDKSLYLQETTGVLPEAELDLAIHNFQTACTIDPSYTPAWVDLFSAYGFLIQFLAQAGRDPSARVRELLHHHRKYLSLELSSVAAYLPIASSLHYYFSYLLAHPAEAAITAAREQQRVVVAEAERRLPAAGIDLTFVHVYRAVDEARILLAKGQDPTAVLQAGDRTAASCGTFAAPYQAECWRLVSSLALLAADWAGQRGQTVRGHLEQAVAAARQAVVLYSEDPQHSLQLLRALLRLAAATVPRSILVAEGLKISDETLRRFPQTAEARALRGCFYLLQVQPSTAEKARLAWAHKAQDDFTAAVRINPFLARVYQSSIAQAKPTDSVK